MKLALTRPRTIPGLTATDMVYNRGTKNLDEYRESGLAEKFPEPKTKELIAVIHDTIEAYEGVWNAGWEIHCYAHLLENLKRNEL